MGVARFADIGLCAKIVKQLDNTANVKVKKMAIIGAFIFASQMLNFPISHGTSGHLIGGVLAAVALGPWAGCLVVAAVLVVQSVLYGDGGLLALGANIINMAAIASIGGYYLYQFFFRRWQRQGVAIICAAGLSVIAAAAAASLEIVLSGAASLGSTLNAMLKYHFFIGLAEGLITWLIIKIFRLCPRNG